MGTLTDTRRPLTADADGERRLAWAVVAVTLAAVAVAYARARWPGYLPLGSDNDEYQLVGQALAAFEPPVVAGVEGTKYPLGYPAILALLAWLRLPVAPAALVLNLVAAGLATGLVAWIAGRRTADLPANPGAALAAGAVVATSVSVWNDAFSVMPELLTLAVVTALLAVVAGGLHPPRVAVLSGLAVAAVLLKTLTLLLVLGGCALLVLQALVARWRGDRTRDRAPTTAGTPDAATLWWRPAIPAFAALVAVVAGMLATRPFPEHTTGYVATFFLRDPFDASLGRLGLRGLVRRTIEDVPETLADLGRAIAFIDASSELAGVIAVVGLLIGVVGAARLRPRGPLGLFAAGAVLAYAIGLSAWPYHSSRFGIPVVPVAALGVGWLVRLVTDAPRRRGGDGPTAPSPRRIGVGLVAGASVLALLVATSWAGLVERGDAATERLSRQHAAMDTLEAWAQAELTDADRLVSFDYREVAHHLDRPVQPLAYTSDPDALLAMVGDADVVVMVDFHHTRNRQLEGLLDVHDARFEQVLEGDGVGVWQVHPPA